MSNYGDPLIELWSSIITVITRHSILHHLVVVLTTTTFDDSHPRDQAINNIGPCQCQSHCRNNVIITSNDAIKLFWRNNDLIATGMPVYHSPPKRHVQTSLGCVAHAPRISRVTWIDRVLGNLKPGAHFTKDISHGIQIRWKFHFALT